MKRMTAVQNSDRNQANAPLAAGSLSRPQAGRTAGWPVRRTPLRHGNQGSRTNKATSRAKSGPNATKPQLTGPGLSFRRILVPIDFSSDSTRAFKIAAALTCSQGASLMLVHVVGPIYDLRDFGYGPVQRRRPNEAMMRRAQQRLRALGRRHVGDKQEWRCAVRSGTASRQILKASEEFEAELVVMPTRGLSHAPPEEVGSTAERVVRHAACPVLVLPTIKPGPKRKGSIEPSGARIRNA